jgi:hypothetical protein
MNWSKASISWGLRLVLNGGIPVSGRPSDIASLISLSLSAATPSGVKAGASPGTPCRFAPWQAAHFEVNKSLADIVAGVGVVVSVSVGCVGTVAGSLPSLVSK